MKLFNICNTLNIYNVFKLMDKLTPEQRHRNMKNIHSKDTKIECMLRKELWNRGIRYRKNYKDLPGKPDIAITRYRIAVFCDSEFFHGKDWEDLQIQLKKGNNPDFWIKKISRNMERDREAEAELKGLGWKVMRFWGKEIKKDAAACAKAVEEEIFETKLERDNVQIY